MKPFKTISFVLLFVVVFCFWGCFILSRAKFGFALGIIASSSLGILSGLFGWRFEGKNWKIITVTIIHSLALFLICAILFLVFFILGNY